MMSKHTCKVDSQFVRPPLAGGDCVRGSFLFFKGERIPIEYCPWCGAKLTTPADRMQTAAERMFKYD